MHIKGITPSNMKCDIIVLKIYNNIHFFLKKSPIKIICSNDFSHGL